MRSAAVLVLVFVATCSARLLAADGTARTIFRCKLDGVTTYSDKPCGGDAQTQALDTTAINTYAPPANASIPTPPAAKTKAKAERGDLKEAKRKESCARYASSLKEIRSKLRAGYTAKEGERLRVRSEKLKEGQRRDRCS